MAGGITVEGPKRPGGQEGRGMAFEFPICRDRILANNLKLDCMKDEMTTLATVLEKLRLRMADNEFRWTPQGFTAGRGKIYQPEDLAILKTYRFEGESDPADSSILYVIEANDNLIGYSLDAYGTYSNHGDEEGYDNFIRKIPIRDHGPQILQEL